MRAIVAQLAIAIAVGGSGLAGAGCKGATKPVAPPTCAAAAGKIARGMIKLREDIATAGIDPAPEVATICDDDAWEAEVIRCYAAAVAPRELRACSDQLSSDQRLHAREVQEELYRRASEVGDGTDLGPTGIAACNDYLAIVERFGECDQIPQGAKDAVGQSVDAMRATWVQAGDDDASREAVEMGCAAAGDALRQMLVSSGC